MSTSATSTGERCAVCDFTDEIIPFKGGLPLTEQENLMPSVGADESMYPTTVGSSSHRVRFVTPVPVMQA
jgi:hypothetical protein